MCPVRPSRFALERFALATVWVASSLLLQGCGPTEAQLEELRATLEAASKRSSQLDALWRRSMNESALRTVRPRPGVPCTLEVSGPADSDLLAVNDHVIRAFTKTLGPAVGAVPSSFDSPLATERIAAARHDLLSRVASPSAGSIRREVAVLGTKLEQGADRTEILLREARSLAARAPAWDVLIVLDEVALPEPDSVPAVDDSTDKGGTFFKGFAIGRTYVYEYASEGIACFARITVESSDRIKAFTWSSDEENRRFVRSQLEKDLWEQILQASGRALVAAAGAP